MNWERIYAHLITITGWTWEYIDEYMTLPRLEALTEYWQELPPPHALLAAYVGYKPKKKLPSEATSKGNDLGELMGLFKSIGGSVKVVKNG